MKKVVFWSILIGFACASIELLSWVCLNYLDREKSITYEPLPLALSEKHRKQLQKLIAHETLSDYGDYFIHSKTLGWVLKPDAKRPRHQSQFTNSQGFRASKDYSKKPSTEMIRLAAFGDSYTYSANVHNDQTWEEELTRLQPQFEVLNFGVGGYGPDQALLRYLQEGIPFFPHIVLIGYASSNIERTVNVFPPFRHPELLPFAKPRFLIKNDQLALMPNPLADHRDFQELLRDERLGLTRLGVYDYFFQSRYRSGMFDRLSFVRLWKIARQLLREPLGKASLYRNGAYYATSEAFAVTLQLFESFYQVALHNDSMPLILLFPEKKDIEKLRRHQKLTYEPLIDQLRISGLQYLDLSGAFEDEKVSPELEALFTGHYSPLANRLIARYLIEYLQTRNWISPSGLTQALEIEQQRHALSNKQLFSIHSLPERYGVN